MMEGNEWESHSSILKSNAANFKFIKSRIVWKSVSVKNVFWIQLWSRLMRLLRVNFRFKPVDAKTTFDAKSLPGKRLLVTQGCKWCSCTPTVLGIEALGYVSGDYSCGFRNLCKVPRRTGCRFNSSSESRQRDLFCEISLKVYLWIDSSCYWICTLYKSELCFVSINCFVSRRTACDPKPKISYCVL